MIFCYLLTVLLAIQQDVLQNDTWIGSVDSWFLERHPSWGEDIFLYDRFQENLGVLQVTDWERFVDLFKSKHPKSPLISVVLLSKIFIDFKNGQTIAWKKIDEKAAQQFFTLLLQYHPEVSEDILLLEFKRYLKSRPLKKSSSVVLIKVLDHLQKSKFKKLYEDFPRSMGDDQEVVFRCAWILYKLGRYSGAKPLFLWLEKMGVGDSLFYLGAMSLYQYHYKNSEEYLRRYLQSKSKNKFGVIHSIDLYVAQKYYASAIYQTGQVEKAYQYLLKIYPKTESLMLLFLKISRKLNKKNVIELVNKFQKKYPTSVSTKRMRRTKAFELLEQKNSQGLFLYQKIYSNHKEDHQVLKYLMLDNFSEDSIFEYLQDPFYDFFIQEKNYVPHGSKFFPRIYKDWIEKDRRNVVKWISFDPRESSIPKLRKPLYIANQKVRKKIFTQLSPFFANYYKIVADSNFLLRLDSFCKRDMESVAKVDIKNQCGSGTAKEFFYRQRLYELGKKYRFASVEMSIKLHTEKLIYYAPYELLQKSFPVCYLDKVKKIARIVGVNPELIYAVMRAESFFDEKAFSSSGAMGLMQLMPSTAEEIYKSKNFSKEKYRWDLFDPELNIFLGAIHLAGLMKHFKGNIFLSAASYNVGRGVVERWIKEEKLPIDWLKFCMSIKYEETYFYLQKVIRNYQIYQILYGEGLKNI